MAPQTILCLDVGSGTQDALYYQSGEELENCPKFILPSPARMVAARIRGLTAKGCALWLHGGNMGGGFKGALAAHLEAGHLAYAHPRAAASLADDPGRVEDMGVVVTEHPPVGAAPVCLADFSPGFWSGLLSQAGLEYPDMVAACAQDHGFHPQASNRRGRFGIWRRFLEEEGGDPRKLIFTRAPKAMTRLAALQADAGGGPVADTGAAAILGALFVPGIEEASRKRGVTLVNLGNSHTIAFTVYHGRVWGVYEHHTGLLAAESLWRDLERFRTGKLDFEEVFAGRGHGCHSLEAPSGAGNFGDIHVLGPRRSILAEYDVGFPAPGGDMMLAGCFGLLKGLEYLAGR
jgi:uncharacterized protein (DUF1786 family)